MASKKKADSTYFSSIKGVSQYTKLQWDYQLKEEWTRNVISIIEDLIVNGYARRTIVNAIVQELNMQYNNASSLYQKVENKLHKSGLELKKVMMSKNVIRLEQLYRKAIAENNTVNALKVIDLLNKTCDVYKPQVEVQANNFTFQLGFTPNTTPEKLIENTEDVEYIEVNENVVNMENNEINEDMNE